DGPERPVLFVKVGESRLFSDISKSPVTVVVVEGVSIHAADKDVLVSVVVVVSDGHAGIVPSPGEPSLFRHIRKRAVSVVMEEPVPVFRRSLLQAGYVRTVGEKDIQVSVIVIIEYGNTASHGFRRMFLRSFAAVQ